MIKDFLKHYLRSGKLFKKYLKELKDVDRYSAIELEEYKNEKLRQTIKIAYENVPFYRKVFHERNLKPRDIKTAEDLFKLPIIDKHVVRENFKDFKNKNFKGLVFKGLTSGTSGTPSIFLRDRHSIAFENAILWRGCQCGGKTFRSRRVTLRGDIVCPIERKRPPFWKVDPFSKELLMSSYHLNDVNLALYVDRIRQYKPFDLYAYPSTAFLLAEYCFREKQNLSFSAVFTSSELVLDCQREKIEEVFQCKIFDWYSQAERVAGIGQCEYGTYHITEDYSLTELLAQQDGHHEIIGTTFNNFIMPLIRYRTGDIMKLDGKAYCKCNRITRNAKLLVGREVNAIKTPDKRAVGILNHIPRGVEHLIELQFVQKTLNEIVLRIVCTDQFSRKDEVLLIKNAQEHISKDMEFSIEKVPAIERGKNGKFIPVISRL